MQPIIVFCIITFVIIVILIVWAIGWNNKTQNLLPQQTSSAETTFPGKAESIVNYLFGSTPSTVTNREISKTELIRQSTQQAVINDLATRLGKIPIQNIVVVSWSERKWLFSGLGCATPQEQLLIEPVNGWIFVLCRADDPNLYYMYHTDQSGNYKFCQTQAGA